jgi:hypothetical protein
MPKIRYVDNLPILRNAEQLALVKHANTIIREYQAQGFDLTLRQLYYQFVSRDLLPNTVQSYKRLGGIIVDGRLAGLIDWDAIVDRTRNLESLAHWASPEAIVDAVSEQFRIDKWARQPNRVEVWIEKEALAGVFERICQELDVPYFCCRGYTSVSEVWSAGQRLLKYRGNLKKLPNGTRGQVPIILHFGDHDPSGMDMTRDIVDRLKMFAGFHIGVERLALNMDQVQTYNPPPNPAKLSDSRAASYIEAYGDESWELDALDPTTLAGLVREAVDQYRDEVIWAEDEAEEEQGRAQLAKIASRFDDVAEFLERDE